MVSSSNTINYVQTKQEPISRSTIQGDELILTSDSGSGTGCWDDEDCTTYPTEAGSGDDLITPRIIRISPQTTPTTRYYATARPTSSSNRGKQCDSDDEDCLEGSGSEDGEDDDDDDEDDNDEEDGQSGPPKGNRYKPDYSGQVPGSRPLAVPPTSPTYSRPDPPRSPFVQPSPPPAPSTPYTEELDRSIMFTSRPIPPVGPIYPTYGYQYPKPRPSPPPRPTGRPVIVDVPKPMIPIHHQKEKEKVKPNPSTHTTSYSKSSADRTALIIGLIAVILIVIVIIAPIIVFIKVRYRSTGACKAIDERNKKCSNYQFAPVAGTPAMLAVSRAGSVSHLGTGAGNGNPGVTSNQQQQQANKLPKKKDLEWYV
ncbi:hypothetical protein HDE_12341 [Halotydeus destructor]|nr:hypothetical protein HDE_12341 [Halotydeus destructor]